MTKHLFLFTITPVQSFVEQARKTQDMYAGSFLLTHLCRTAANKMKSDYKSHIIFPDIDIGNKSVPNRFIAIVETEESKLKGIGEVLQGAVELEFKQVANSVISSFGINKDELKGFDEQIRTYFTVNWLFLPYDEANYQQCYDEIESLMGAIKTVRKFKQFPDSEKGRKCSVCGERNVKFYRKTESENGKDVKVRKLFSNDVFVVDYKKGDTLWARYLRAGEGLCAVCFTKRCLDKSGFPYYDAKFPSTAKIALFDAFNRLKEKDNNFSRVIDSDNYEPQGIFDLKNDKSLEDMSDAEKANTQNLYNALKECKIDFSPYYAVMLFDGDSMGEWLSGDRIKKDRNLKEFHESLTKKLGIFANTVRDIIKEPTGVTVYAGGEDFLGFFNLNNLLTGLKTLREKFDEVVSDPLNDFIKDKPDKMTFSAGVVIAHIKTPLSEVLSWARKMEREAKEIDDNKNAFAIAVLKHSGEIEETVFKWRLDNQYVTEIISEMVSEIKADRLSNTFIKKLNQEMLRLMDRDGKYIEDQIIKTEIKRLLSRSCMKTKDESKEDFESRKKETVNNLSGQLSKILTESKRVGNFLSLISIADFIARQIKGEMLNEN